MLRERLMLGPGSGAVKENRRRAALVACCALLAGCFWQRYPDRLRVHDELLVAMARKARDLVATGRFTAESLPELTYPLERATAFAAEAHRRAPVAPASLVAFDRLLAQYRAYVQAVDDARRTQGGPAAAAPLDGPLAALEAAARDVAAALARERSAPGQ